MRGYFDLVGIITYDKGGCQGLCLSFVGVLVLPPKLARLIYTMLTKGEEFTDQGQEYYEERYRERTLRQLAQRAEKWA